MMCVRFQTSILLLVAAIVLAGCSPSNTPSGSQQLQGRILIWHTWGESETAALNEILTRFREIHPGVAINHQSFAQVSAMLGQFETAADSGLGPDLLIAPSNWIRPLAEAALIDGIGGNLSEDVLVRYATVTLDTVVAWIANEVLGRIVLPRTTADPGVINTIRIISRYAIIGIGILTAISTLGFDLSALAIIGGGLSVGLGFGLQELVANFVSGILLLFERTLKPGDVIEIGASRGVIDHFSIRATVVRMANNIEILISKNPISTAGHLYS